ncbi:hypothetical protein ACE7GA_23370 [Roseomonas sp. CCTCC AB2023176]|uniref:hypothetical protein n=1 Tax=Roseomonas sp. CCTCC AB2023176 TaxID=3342640 RepID=UPI0035D8A272
MTLAETQSDPGVLPRFVGLAGKHPWEARLAELARRAGHRSLSGRECGRRHLLELTLARLAEVPASTQAERVALAFARDAVALAESLPEPPRGRFRDRLAAGLTGEGTLIPLFHLLRVAAMQRARGFEVRFTGLADGTDHDLLISRDGMEAEVACETMSAEEGRSVHRGDWCALVDGINPDLQTWLAAHPGRYVLKMTLPDGMKAEALDVPALHRRIVAMLQAQKRQDAAADAILKLDPLVLAGAQAAAPAAALRAQFGPEAHLAVTQANGSMLVLAARAGQANDIAAAACRRAGQACGRLSGERPGMVALFLDELERTEWRTLRHTLELEGAVRRFLTTAPAKRLVAVTCASRMEMFAEDGRRTRCRGRAALPQPRPPRGQVGGAAAGHRILGLSDAGPSSAPQPQRFGNVRSWTMLLIPGTDMSEAETEKTYAELDRLLNDPEVRMDASRVWTLLDRIASSETEGPPLPAN